MYRSWTTLPCAEISKQLLTRWVLMSLSFIWVSFGDRKNGNWVIFAFSFVQLHGACMQLFANFVSYVFLSHLWVWDSQACWPLFSLKNILIRGRQQWSSYVNQSRSQIDCVTSPFSHSHKYNIVLIMSFFNKEDDHFGLITQATPACSKQYPFLQILMLF